MSISVDKLANNIILILAARVAMIVTLPLAWLYLEGRFDSQAAATNILSLRVDKVEDATSTLDNRILVIETNNIRGRAERDRFQVEALDRLDRLQDTTVTLSNAIAALTATVQTMRDRASLQQRSRLPTVTR